jgi:hypothetical protein
MQGVQPRTLQQPVTANAIEQFGGQVGKVRVAA